MKLIIDMPDELYQMLSDEKEQGKHHEFYERIIMSGIPLEEKTGQFAEWVAEEIFDENWEYNKDAFAELACRKLAKLGIVRAKGNEWELVDPQENCETCKHKEESWDSEHCDGCCGNYSGFEPQESEVEDV